jgi:RNA polymerase sporulation-specific sigma factor
MQLRNQRKSRGEVSLYDPIGVDREGNEISLIDVLGSEPDLVPEAVTTKLQVAALAGYLDSLEPKERLVVQERFGLGTAARRTQRQIAKSLGISRSYVSRIEKRAVTKLLREIDPDEARERETP